MEAHLDAEFGKDSDQNSMSVVSFIHPGEKKTPKLFWLYNLY